MVLETGNSCYEFLKMHTAKNKRTQLTYWHSLLTPVFPGFNYSKLTLQCSCFNAFLSDCRVWLQWLHVLSREPKFGPRHC